MIGPILIIAGAYWFWVLFHGRAGDMWNAITGNSGFSANLDSLANAINPQSSSGGNSSSSGGTSTGSGSGNAPDSGTHMGIDPNGNIITINSPYGSMTPAEQDAANAYAHQIGNISG